MLLEDAPGSTRPVKSQEPHFKVFEEFNAASYARRYEILLTKLVRERLYDATCFLMSNSVDGLKGQYFGARPGAQLHEFHFFTHRQGNRAQEDSINAQTH